jgi:hypothetical protein
VGVFDIGSPEVLVQQPEVGRVARAWSLAHVQTVLPGMRLHLSHD